MRIGIMVDTESLGLLPDSIMREFAMVAFDLDDPETIVREVLVEFPLETQEVLGRKVSLATVGWMLKDSSGKYAKAIEENLHGDLDELTALIRSVNRKFTLAVANAESYEVWVRRPQHDIPMIKSLWLAVGEELPWLYDSVQDLATFQRQAGIKKGEVDQSGLVLHTALGDCHFQIRCYAEAHRRLRVA